MIPISQKKPLSQNLRILNGRTTGDSYGRFTSYNVSGGASVVDYAIVPDDQFNKVDSFVVKPPNLLSDHCQIIVWIDTKRNDTFIEPTSTNYKWEKVPTKFKWKTNSKSKYSKALQNNKHTKMIRDFLENRFNNSTVDVDKACKLFQVILLSAAKSSLSSPRKTRGKTISTDKKWFDSECKTLKDELQYSLKERHRNPENVNWREKCKDLSKTFANRCKLKKKSFWENKINELQNSEPEEFWDKWKTFDDNRTPSSSAPNLKDGNVWEKYYTKLFQNNCKRSSPNIPANSQPQAHNANKSLNAPISENELNKCIKKLKNGKATGLDQISNEMIKTSFPLMKEAFLKLLNLCLESGCVPSIWCKSIISHYDFTHSQIWR